MYDVVFIEEMNKPAVMLHAQGFENDARATASLKGMPTLRLVAVPPSLNEVYDANVAEQGVSAVIDNIVVALTKPLTTEEKSPKPKELEKTSGIVFKGNLEEVNRFFYMRGWTDGLPIIPPTKEAVAEMLTGTDLPADHVVSKLLPRLGKATVEKIAINAVMAGCLPTYMPPLIAGVQDLAEPASGYRFMHASTTSSAPFWIINGPIRNEINVNSSSGVLSPGNIANATIGRAMQLMIRTIGGSRKGIEEMGTWGHPGKYTMVVAENEEESPWEPLHVEQGFNKEDSTVSVFFTNRFWQGVALGSKEGVLSILIQNVLIQEQLGFALLTPSSARFLAGMTKKEIIDLVSDVTWHQGEPVHVGPARHEPSAFRLLVTGGEQNWTALYKMMQQGVVTKKVELPANWNKLVAKYKNIVPTYVRY